jgi:hypothetical protein
MFSGRQNLLGVSLMTSMLAFSAMAYAAKGTIDAASMKVTVYKFAVSTNRDCSNPRVVFTNAAGVESDLLSNPTPGSGPVDPGSYQCVLIELSKTIKTSAATSGGACTARQEFSDVICQDGQQSQLVDGTSVTCSGSATNPQHVTLFVTTASAGNGGERALLPPTGASDSTSGLKLDGPLVVTRNAPVTLSVDPKKFLDGSQGGICSTSAPSFAVN